MNKEQVNARQKRARIAASKTPNPNPQVKSKFGVNYAKIKEQAATKTPKANRTGSYYHKHEHVVTRPDGSTEVYTSYKPLGRQTIPGRGILKPIFEKTMSMLGLRKEGAA
jgi:hypothetical protein